MNKMINIKLTEEEIDIIYDCLTGYNDYFIKEIIQRQKRLVKKFKKLYYNE